jgi:hypothetical protein
VGSYTTYRSGVHVASMVLQVLRGLDAGCAFCENLFEVEVPDSDCGAGLLCALLRNEGLSAEPFSAPPPFVERFAVAAYSAECLIAVQFQTGPPNAVKRWGLVQGIVAGKIQYGIAVGDGDPVSFAYSLAESATGEVVVIFDEIPQDATILARAYQPQ